MDDNRRRLEIKLGKSYDAILNSLKRYEVDADTLRQLKQRFGSIIDSPRRVDQIKCLADLVHHLDRQLLIDYNDMKYLSPILEICRIENGLRRLVIEHYKLLIEYNQLYYPNNFNRDNNANGAAIPEHEIPVYVSEKICSSIGSSWKEFAYALGIKSKDIDRIDSQCRESKSKAREVMTLFMSHQNSNKRDIILEALAAARKNRLKKEIKHMLLKSCVNCRCYNNES
ncbi:hypothetical protein O3M35_000181 [Rhynocoris fuscipes]|uniref:Death domain-containing protein n=1 Tax=Rhynocoris fuscipes TaxID=488301 RepID=A0AAW1DSA6_9HEMI